MVTEKIEGEGFRWQRVGLNGWKLSPQGAKLAWSTSNLLDGDQYAACIAQGHVYLTSPRGLHVFELTTGKQAAHLPQGDGHRTNLPFAAGDRLFIQAEGRHGSQGFKMFDLTDPAQPEPAA